jgi:hypothetical protein
LPLSRQLSSAAVYSASSLAVSTLRIGEDGEHPVDGIVHAAAKQVRDVASSAVVLTLMS